MQSMTADFPVRYDAAEPAERNRLMVLLRIFMMIPHMIVLYIYNIAAEVVVVIHWFVIVFTGKRNSGMFNFVNGYLAYNARVSSYGALLHDQFPGFGPDDPGSPVSYAVTYTEEANRLTVALRIIFAIPAMIIAMLYGIAAFFYVIIQWFTIVITGKQSQSAWLFTRKVMKLTAAVNAYIFLQHDDNPMPARVGMS